MSKAVGRDALVDEVALDAPRTAAGPHISEFFEGVGVLTPPFGVNEDTLLNHLGPINLY